MDITSKYVDAVIIKEEGKAAMELASQVALDFFLEKDLSYLESKEIREKNNINFLSDTTFCEELKNYIEHKNVLFKKTEEPQEKNTREAPFSIHQEAKCASDIYK